MDEKSISSRFANLIRSRGLSDVEVAELIHALQDIGYRLLPVSVETLEEAEQSELTATMDSVDEELVQMFQDEYADSAPATDAPSGGRADGHTAQSGERFEFVREFARGGVGSISLVRDQELRRTIVMKTLIDGHDATEYVRNKFVEEAQITAQLEHPNIVPVHEFGHLKNGEMFFTMKLVQGRTLKEVLRALRTEDASVQGEFSRTRLIGMFISMCQAIAFAHSRNVIHRDIKPANIMIGDFGEVLLLDWGVAKVLGTSSEEELLEQAVQTERSTAGDATMMGLITGTPSYMPPEQAAGRIDRLDGRADVYALGAVLYEILTLRRPFHEKTQKETLKAVITQQLRAPTEVAPNKNIPAALEGICVKALAKRPKDRYQSVADMLTALNAYLSGVEDRDRRERQSEERLEASLEFIAQYHRARAETLRGRDELLDLEWDTPPYADKQTKSALWASQSRLRQLEAELNRTFEVAVKTLVEAIGFNPNNDEACNELARLYWSALTQAEQDGDKEGAQRFRALVATYDRGLYAEQLTGVSRLNIRTAPITATVEAGQIDEDGHIWRTKPAITFGTTPLGAYPIEEGAWQLNVSAPGYRNVTMPILVQRAEIIDISCRLFTDEEIGTHYLHVPAGRFIAGGDPTSAAAMLRRVEELDDFFVARYPVTCAEYLAFLRDLDKSAPEEAIQRAPRTRPDGGQLWGRAEGRIVWPQMDRHGYRWAAHWPVFGVSFDDAERYVEWYRNRTGIAVRLPTELEWEKAARGVDGRWYPWGDVFDETFCKMARSTPGSPMPTRVGSFSTDCSPYGVFDMAGLVREYCDSTFDADESLRVVRGGSYLSQGGPACRTTHRQAVLRDVPNLDHGFRLVRVPEKLEH